MSDITTRRLGRSGLAVSSVGLGANNFGLRIDAAQTRRVVDAALDAGITLIDTSDSYGESESILGEVLQGRRDDVVLATKFGSQLRRDGVPADWGARGSRRYIRQAVERSLRRLRTDWIDLYQLHFPDPSTPIDETLAALDDLVHEGKVRYVGSSNFAGWQVADADWTARTTGTTRLSARRTTTTCSNGARNADSFPHWSVSTSACCRTSRSRAACSPGSTGATRPRPRAPGWRRGACKRAHRCPLRCARGLGGVRAGTRRDHGVGRHRLARRAATVASVIAGATSAEQVTANAAAVAWAPSADDLAELDHHRPRRLTPVDGTTSWSGTYEVRRRISSWASRGLHPSVAASLSRRCTAAVRPVERSTAGRAVDSLTTVPCRPRVVMRPALRVPVGTADRVDRDGQVGGQLPDGRQGLTPSERTRSNRGWFDLTAELFEDRQRR